MIFDLDGTVWDSRPGILACMLHAFSELGLEPPDEQRMVAAIGPPLRTMLADLGVAEHLLDEGVAAYRERYLTTGVYEAELFPGVVEVIELLVGRGDRLATATSKGSVPTDTMLGHFGIRDRFEVVGAATMDGTATTKSEVLALTLAGLGDPDPTGCRMVGDRHHDVEGAAGFGIRCVGVAWGYGGRDELLAAGADAVAEAPSDLPGLLR